MSVTETMGERIHNLRELRSLTRESLVTQMKIIDKDFAISLSSLSRLESNRSYSSKPDKEKALPTLNSTSLSVLAKALGCTPDFLLGFSDQVRPLDLTHGDSNLSYLLTLLEKMTPAQRQEVTRYAALISSGVPDVIDLRDRFLDLYNLCTTKDAIAVIGTDDPRLKEGARVASVLAITNVPD